MKVMIIYAHPYEKSFNNAILEKIQKGLKENNNEIDILDLNEDNFNPVLDKESLAVYSKGESKDPKVKQYQDRIKNAEYLFFVFPIWWTTMPAILKGFIDKVFLPLFAFKKEKIFPKPYLKHFKGAAVFTTMSSPKFYYSCFLKSPIKRTLIKGTLKFCGIKKVKWFSFASIDNSTDKKREKWLLKAEKIVANIK